VYGRLITAADAAPATLEPAARSNALRREGRLAAAARVGTDITALHEALDSYQRAALAASPEAARRAFALLAGELEAIDYAEAPVLRHEQALRDVEALDASLGALAEGDPEGAARELEEVGRNSLARHLSEELATLDAERHHPGHDRLAWAEGAHLTASPILWRELASLRADPSAAPAGPWIGESLARARRQSAADLKQRLDRMTEAFELARELLDPTATTTEEP
jgi:hypothetical protein